MYTYKYPRPAVTVDAIVVKKGTGELLLIQRANDPFAGKWALPGGFVEMDELLVDSCKRELEEETGLKLDKLEFFKLCDAPDRDPRGRTISAVYYGFANDTAEVQGADDALNADWFSFDNLPDLAFDHADIIREFVTKILQK